jgi:flagellar assembly protein FliH
MSSVVPKDEAEKLAFRFQPESFKVPVSTTAKGFIQKTEKATSDFVISHLVEESESMAEVKKRLFEEEIEESVLQRIKELEEEAYKKAYAVGLAEGTEKAFQESQAQIVEKLKKFDELLANLDNLKTLIGKENEVQIVKLTLSIGQKIAAREIAENQEPILDMIKELIDGIKKDEKIVVKVSATDLDFIEDLRRRNDERSENLQNVKLVGNGKVEQGGCIVETNYGSIDATVAERVERVWAALLARVPDLRFHKTTLSETESTQAVSGGNESGT